jgi:hypothetical protein
MAEIIWQFRISPPYNNTTIIELANDIKLIVLNGNPILNKRISAINVFFNKI